MKIKKSLPYILLIASALSFTACDKTSSVSLLSHKIKSGSDMTFFVTTDIHYLSKDLTDNGEAFQEFTKSGDGKEVGYIDDIVNAFTNDIKKKKPDVLIISGDLTTNGEKKSHLSLAEKLKAIEKTGTSVYVIPGNHDIFNPYARAFKGEDQLKTDYISDKDFSSIYKEFGYGEAVSRDKNTLSYLAEPSEDVWLLMLDTAQYKDNIKKGSPQLDGRISSETFEWIKKCSDMAKEKGAKIITVMHHNMLNHSDVVREGFTLNDNEKALDKFHSMGMNLFLSGHIHIQDISSTKKDNDTIYDIVTSSLAVYPQQYGVIKYSKKTGIDYNTSRVDVEGYAKESGIKDPNLLNFSSYSEKSFGERSYARTYSNLLMADAYTDEQIKLMAETTRLLNLRYFSGTEYLNSKDVVNSEGFKLLISDNSGFSSRYALSIVYDNDTDDNKLHIDN